MIHALQPVAKLQQMVKWDLLTKFKHMLQVKMHCYNEIMSVLLRQDNESVNLLGCWVLRNTASNDSVQEAEGFGKSWHSMTKTVSKSQNKPF